jgi:uncharacterized protein (DUF111 family)
MTQANFVSLEQWVALGMFLMTLFSVGVSLATALTSIRRSSFTQLESRVEKLEKRLRSALIANTKMRAIIQDTIDVLDKVINSPRIPVQLKNEAKMIIEKAKQELAEAEILLVESITNS